MPVTEADGISTRYRIAGSGTPILMFSPGGFNASLDKWWEADSYKRIQLMSWLPEQFKLVTFDRRENGESGGRLEIFTWDSFADQGRDLLRHLEIQQAVVFGGCMGCPTAAAFAVKYPDLVSKLILYWPVGGAHYRIRAQRRFAAHAVYVQEKGLKGLIDLVEMEPRPFAVDPRQGPWASVIASDSSFKGRLAELDEEQYLLLIDALSRTLIDRDTAPGPEPEALMRLSVPTLVVSGNDRSHAPSAAQYLSECISTSELIGKDEIQSASDAEQTILRFLNQGG